MLLETLAYWLMLSLALAQNGQPSRLYSFSSHSLKAASTFSYSVARYSNHSVRSTTLSKTSSKPSSVFGPAARSTSSSSQSTLLRSSSSGPASQPIVPEPSSSVSITVPPSSSLATSTNSLVTPFTTSVSDGKTIAIALGAAAGAIVVVGGVGGGFVAFGSAAPFAVAAGQVLELRPDSNSNDGEDELEVQTLSSISISLTTSEQTTSAPRSTTSSTSTSTSSPTSSALPSQTPANYVVFLRPEIAANPTQRADFEKFLDSFAEPDTLKDLAREFGSDEDIGVFVLDTTEDNATAISQDPRVQSIDLNSEAELIEPISPVASQQEEFTRETFDNVVLQSPSQKALNDLSLPLEANVDGVTPNDIPGYAFPAAAGKGVTIYILDTGGNPNHDEYTKAEGTKRWLFANEDKTESDDVGHGSCMQSLASGPLFGAAKAADIVIVKLGARSTMDNALFGLILILQDVIQNKLQGKAVINMSIGYKLLVPSTNTRGRKPGFVQKDGIDGFKQALQLLIEQDVVVVTASGNDRDDPNAGEHITAFPAFFGRQMDIITVGAVDENGKRTYYSQGVPAELDTSAIGTATCASNKGNEDVELDGTSISTPLVTGMIATWLSDPQYKDRLQVPGKVAANVKKMVKELSYNRIGGGDTPVAWNGVDIFTCQSDSESGGSGPRKLRARAGKCAIKSTSTLIPTSTQPAVPTSTAPAAPPVVTPSAPAVVPSATPTPVAPPPVPCYNFNINAYGYCCPGPNSPCEKDLGTCYLPFKGEGVGGGGDGRTTVPTGARCPPPPGAADSR